MAWYKCSKQSPSPTWATASNAELTELFQKHYAGEIDLHNMEGFEIGAERQVYVSAMTALNGSETHSGGYRTFVLMNAGGKILSDGTTECAFVVGMKECLENGKMNWNPNTSSNAGGWRDTQRRTWANSKFYNALPSTFKTLFKQFKNISSKGNGATSGTYETIDYFAFPAEIEVLGTTKYSVAGEGSQFKYYENVDNRKKIRVDINTYAPYWTRSAPKNGDTSYLTIKLDGTISEGQWYDSRGISLFGCI